MSRSVDVDFIANQIVEAVGGPDRTSRDRVKSNFERLTFGLAEYERQKVVWLVNFRLASAVL